MANDSMTNDCMTNDGFRFDPSELATVRDRIRGYRLDDLDPSDIRSAVALSRQVESAVASFRVRLGHRANELQAQADAAARAQQPSDPGSDAGQDEQPAGSAPGTTPPDDGARTAFDSPEVPSRESARDLHRLHIATNYPLLGAAYHAGHVEGHHLDVLYRLTLDLDDHTSRSVADADQQITSEATKVNPATFTRFVKRLIDQIGADAARDRAHRQRLASNLRSWRTPDGMGHIHVELDPEWYETLTEAIDAETRSLANQADGTEPIRVNNHLRAQALLELVTGHRGAQGRPSIIVIVDAETAANGPHPHTTCETAQGTGLSHTTLNRLACDAVLRTVLLDDDYVPINLGRERRTASPAQWAALKAIYTTCAWANCERPITWCQAHHLQPWEHEGPTDLNNLIPLCTSHHHQTHEGRWHLKLAPNRSLHIHQPDGTHWATTHPDRTPTPKPPQTDLDRTDRTDQTEPTRRNRSG